MMSGSSAVKSASQTLPMPFSHQSAGSNIKVGVDATNIEIATGTTWTGYTGHITILYTKT